MVLFCVVVVLLLLLVPMVLRSLFVEVGGIDEVVAVVDVYVCCICCVYYSHCCVYIYVCICVCLCVPMLYVCYVS